MAWDDTAGAVKFMPIADLTAEASPATGDVVLIYGAEGDLRAVDWGDLPGAGIGSGDVVGPASATDNAIARFNGTGGKTIQNTGVSIDDSDNLSIPGIIARTLRPMELPPGRLTLSTGVPVINSTVSGAGTLYYTPHVGDVLWLYDGSAGWDAVAFSELSIALSGGTASRLHDVFVYNNAGTATLELTAWTNDTTRATALVLQNGRYVQTGATTRLYLGTIYIDGSKQCNFITGGVAANGTAGVVGLWNAYHRHRWSTFSGDSTDSWSYTTAGWRVANNSSTLRTSFVVGLVGNSVDARYLYASNYSGTTGRNAIGYDSTSVPYDAMGIATAGPAGAQSAMIASIIRPEVGYHYATALEFGATTVTWYGDVGLATVQSGLHCSGMF